MVRGRSISAIAKIERLFSKVYGKYAKIKFMNKPIKKVLKNGMRIIVIPMKKSPTVTTLILVEAGSK